MYERMNENNDINIMKDNRVSLHIDINNIESVVATRPVIPRPPSPDTCIICFDGCGHLTGEYTVWGQVISGMEAVENLAVGEPPSNPDKMISVKLGKK